jgi:hypothetical protein
MFSYVSKLGAARLSSIADVSFESHALLVVITCSHVAGLPLVDTVFITPDESAASAGASAMPWFHAEPFAGACSRCVCLHRWGFGRSCRFMPVGAWRLRQLRPRRFMCAASLSPPSETVFQWYRDRVLAGTPMVRVASHAEPFACIKPHCEDMRAVCSSAASLVFRACLRWRVPGCGSWTLRQCAGWPQRFIKICNDDRESASAIRRHDL